MADLNERIACLQSDHDQQVADTTVTQTALRRLEEELADQWPLSEERWFGLPAGRRNEFLRLLFPNGLFVRPAPATSKRGSIEGRVAMRYAAE